MRNKFVDVIRLLAKGGNGGFGLPKYGGVGGKGGDVFVCAVEGQSLVETIKNRPGRHWKAGVGGNSRQFRILGEPGPDLVVPVPPGTIVASENGVVIGEVNVAGDKVFVAQGGIGGSPLNQFHGQKGQMRQIKLELKLIADVGLVGFPNAGKSTFLRAVSPAIPKVASYPFTTIQPTIGIIKYSDDRTISVADLPGLIEGAWANMGMGHKFLRHVERTKLLLFIVDINGFRLGPRYAARTAVENVLLLNRELELYQADLLDKPSLLLINKMDTNGAEEKLKSLLADLSNLESVSRTYPEEMQPDKFVNFLDIIPCALKFNQESTDYITKRLREVLDVQDEMNRVDSLENDVNKVKMLLSQRTKQLL